MTTSAAKKKMLPRLAAVPNLMNCGTDEYHASRSLVLMVLVEVDDAHDVFAAAARARAGRGVKMAGRAAAATDPTIALRLPAAVEATDAAAAATAWSVMVDFDTHFECE
mmetsp:Transcript_11869/g.28032  ORF Transcript_11869/g.28032 Transcript_11869/m.28032 type:complete len:109 (+) Transcript_11869:434-760(+)